MGCKINKKTALVEDSIKVINKATSSSNNQSNDGVKAINLDVHPVVFNEKDIRFKASELVGEKKGSILDHYTFEKDLGAGFFSSFCLFFLFWS